MFFMCVLTKKIRIIYEFRYFLDNKKQDKLVLSKLLLFNVLNLKRKSMFGIFNVKNVFLSDKNIIWAHENETILNFFLNYSTLEVLSRKNPQHKVKYVENFQLFVLEASFISWTWTLKCFHAYKYIQKRVENWRANKYKTLHKVHFTTR